MKPLPNAILSGRCIAQCALAAALFLGACSATTGSLKNATERHGQVKFSSAKEQIVGEIAIRHTDDHFRAEITKGPGVPLLTIAAKFSTKTDKEGKTVRQMDSAHLHGALAHGGFTWRPKNLARKNFPSEKLTDPNLVWATLPEVFMWGEAEAAGKLSVVTLPDVVMHSRANNGHVKNFDYARHANPTAGEPADLRTLRKQPTLENVICHLD